MRPQPGRKVMRFEYLQAVRSVWELMLGFAEQAVLACCGAEGCVNLLPGCVVCVVWVCGIRGDPHGLRLCSSDQPACTSSDRSCAALVHAGLFRRIHHLLDGFAIQAFWAGAECRVAPPGRADEPTTRRTPAWYDDLIKGAFRI